MITKFNQFKKINESSSKKTKLSDVKPKKGKMHKMLGIPEDKEITDVYNSGKKLAKDLVDKVGKKKAAGMLAFVANINKEHNIYDKALKSIESIKESNEYNTEDIKECTEDIKERFEDYLEIELPNFENKFNLIQLAKQHGLSINLAFLLCVNLRDLETMEELSIGDYSSTFDPYDSHLFNEEYDEIMDEYGSEEYEDIDENKINESNENDPSNIEEYTKDIKQYFEDYLEIDLLNFENKFNLTELADEHGITIYQAYILCVNLEDLETMEELSIGDYTTSFDPYNSSLFNDGYDDTIYDTGLGYDEHDNEDDDM